MIFTDKLKSESYKYTPWGEPTIYSGSGEIQTESQFENPYLYAGREVDILDGGMLKLQINRHRILNYPLARWMQPDPRGVVPNDYYNPFNPEDQYGDGVNVYQYCGNEPVGRNDAFGLQDVSSPYSSFRVIRALRQINAFHRDRIYFDTTGINSLISKMARVALEDLTIGDMGSSAKSDAMYYPNSDSLYAPNPVSEESAFHEMVHALDDYNGWYIAGTIDYMAADGLAETATKLVSRANHAYWKSLENSNNEKDAETFWYYQWNMINVILNEAYTVVYPRYEAPINREVDYPVEPSIIVDVKDKLGVSFSCSKIKSKYDAYFKTKGLCPKLNCDNITRTALPVLQLFYTMCLNNIAQKQ